MRAEVAQRCIWAAPVRNVAAASRATRGSRADKSSGGAWSCARNGGIGDLRMCVTLSDRAGALRGGGRRPSTLPNFAISGGTAI